MSSALNKTRRFTNNDKKESRRHCSLEAYNVDGNLIPAKGDFLKDFLNKSEIDWALSGLKQENQSLVRWYYLDDVPVNEIAERLGIKTPAVYRRLDRSIKKLKEILTRM